MKHLRFGKNVSYILAAAVLAGSLNGFGGPDNLMAASSEVSQQPQAASGSSLYQGSIQSLEEQIKKIGAPASFTLMKDGKIIYSKGFGIADKEKNIPVTNETLFNIGSVSKIFTTAALLKLQQDGKLSLDDPVTKYLPDFKMPDQRYKKITVRMLLNHTSGLPGDSIASGSLLAEKDGNYNIYGQIMGALAETKLQYAPGSLAVYCNDGFILAQRIIENISRKTYEDYLQDTFLKPLKLYNTLSSSNLSLAAEKDFAHHYDGAGNVMPREISTKQVTATGGLSSTPEDLARFIHCILTPGNGILNDESIRQLRADQSLGTRLGKASGLNGLGWDYILPDMGTQVFSKAGGTTAYAAKVLSAPDIGITVAGTALYDGLFTSAVYAAGEQFMRDVLAEEGILSAANTITPETADAPKELESFSGMYGYTKFEIEKNSLTISQFTGTAWSKTATMPYREDGTFGVDAYAGQPYSGIRFTRVDGMQLAVQENLPAGSHEKSNIWQKHPFAASKSEWELLKGSVWLNSRVLREDYQAAYTSVSEFVAIPELDGYIEFGALLQTVSSTRAEAPVETAQSLGDLVKQDKNLRFAGNTYIPLSSAKTLDLFSTQDIYLRGENEAQWYFVPNGGKLKTDAGFSNVRIIAFDANFTPIFDNISQTGSVEIPKNSYIVFSGKDGAHIKINYPEK